MALPDPHQTELLYRALAAPIGIAVVSNDAERARQALYVTRQRLGDPQLARLSFRLNPLMPGQEIWLLKANKLAADNKDE